MNEPTEIKYPLDSGGEPYYAATHVQAVQGSVDGDWTEFDLLNGAVKNTEFSADGENGFPCSYKIVNLFGMEIKSIRLNGKNMKDGQVIASIPNLTDHAQSFNIRTSKRNVPGMITIRSNGETKFIIDKDTSWTKNDYIYGQHTWIE